MSVLCLEFKPQKESNLAPERFLYLIFGIFLVKPKCLPDFQPVCSVLIIRQFLLQMSNTSSPDNVLQVIMWVVYNFKRWGINMLAQSLMFLVLFMVYCFALLPLSSEISDDIWTYSSVSYQWSDWSLSRSSVRDYSLTYQQTEGKWWWNVTFCLWSLSRSSVRDYSLTYQQTGEWWWNVTFCLCSETYNRLRNAIPYIYAPRQLACLWKAIFYDYTRRLLNPLLNIIPHVLSPLDPLRHVTSHDHPTYCCIQPEMLRVSVCVYTSRQNHITYMVHSWTIHYEILRRACSTYGEKWNACSVLVGKSEGKRPLGRRNRWEDNIKIDLREIV
jgi:hypothetical protein